MRPLLLLAGSTAGLVLLTSAAPAAAAPGPDRLADAQHRAVALREQVVDLERRTDAAVEEYDGAQEALAAAVSRQVQAEQLRDAARSAGRSADLARTARIRTLYEVGGPAAVYGSALRAPSPRDALRAVHDAQRLLGSDGAAAARDSAATRARDAAAREADGAAGARVRQTQRVAALVARVQALLAEQQALLAAADRDVVRIAREQQEEAERRQQAAFQAALAAAREATAREAAAREATAREATAREATAREATAPGTAAGETTVRPATAGEVARTGRTGVVPRGRSGADAGPPAVDTGVELPPSQRAAVVLAAARAQLGKPYVWGATGPDSFDCSGLTRWAYAAAGVRLPRTAAQQWSAGRHPALADLQPGDLLFWASDPGDPGTIHHVAIYVGQGRMIAAPHTGAVVQVQQVYANGFFGATRIG